MPISAEEIKAHFDRAKEIRCINHNILVDVSAVKDFEFYETTNEWRNLGGTVCFWKDGTFAEITRKKCNPENCKGCKPCREKTK
jgi:hypothetical protein